MSYIKGVLRCVYHNLLVMVCALSQRRVLSRLRHYDATRKIKVLFYVIDASKWKCQRVYDLMTKSSDFDPIVAIGVDAWGVYDMDAKSCENAICELETFFHGNGCRTVRAYDPVACKYIPPNVFGADVVFLQEPWAVSKPYLPHVLSRSALPFYVPYYTQVRFKPDIECWTVFHRCLYAYFMISEEWALMFRSATKRMPIACHYIATGHPALDEYQSNDVAEEIRDYVIYAPHFSFLHPNNHVLLQYGTFEWNGREILEYAKKHSEYHWLFKPHPTLYKQLINTGFMSEDAVRKYYSEWEECGTVCVDGNYSKYFKKARAIITDCSSFLAEFGSTGMPVIRLMPACGDVGGADLSEGYLKTYYNVYDLRTMYETLAMILERHEDPNRNERLLALQANGMIRINAAENIVKYLGVLCCRN